MKWNREMALIVNLEQAQELEGELKQWAYNALDVTGTREIADVLLPRLSPAQQRTYAFELALQAPALSAMLRGVRVNVVKRAEMVTQLKRELAKDERQIAKMPQVTEVWDGAELETGWCPVNLGKRHKWPRGVPDGPEKKCEHCGVSRIKYKAFEPGSSSQTAKLFYGLHKVPPITNKQGNISTDDDSLEKIGQRHPELRPLTEAIQSVRDKKKQLGTLSAKLTKDERYPSSFNVGAAWTGRFSSSKNPYGLGGNLQNVTERHRHGFLADPGMDMSYVDLKTAESNVVAHVAGDEKYIEAHKSGDVHTYVTRLVWPELGWTGDLKEDKRVAKQLPEWDNVDGHDYRFQAKRIQHGSNFGLTPFGISMIAHIPLEQAKRAYERYMTEFDGIPRWQAQIKKQVMDHVPLVNPLGRSITLMGRPWDKHTWRQGFSFIPQSTVADLLDLAMWRVWRKYDPWFMHLLAQVHDALLIQYQSDKLYLLKQLAREMELPVPVLGADGKTRMLKIAIEAAVGKNWGKKSDANPYGIVEIDI
jgi:DNA polymerase I-like protein with 3'-5' exonuclease and polymerase domains